MPVDETNAEGVLHGVTRLYNRVEIDVVLLDRNPGCAARSRASLLDLVGVDSIDITGSQRPPPVGLLGLCAV